MSKKPQLFHAAGRRKTAIARATLKPGKGVVRFNNVLLENVQPKMIRHKLMEPLMLLDKSLTSKVNIDITVKGGGQTSQSDAACIAMSRALSEFGGETVRADILAYNRALLVADTRVKEKTKPNCCGSARSKRQKSYR